MDDQTQEHEAAPALLVAADAVACPPSLPGDAAPATPVTLTPPVPATPPATSPSLAPTPRDLEFMALALDEARRAAEEGEVPIGAVVVCEGRVVARAHNRRETDADPSAHAEFSALVQASRALGRWRLTGCTVYVTLEPCLMCAGLMVNARVDRCVYGAADPKGGALGTLYDVSHDPRLNHEFEVVPGVRAEEAAELLRAFFRDRRRARRAARRAAAAGAAGRPPAPDN